MFLKRHAICVDFYHEWKIFTPNRELGDIRKMDSKEDSHDKPIKGKARPTIEHVFDSLRDLDSNVEEIVETNSNKGTLFKDTVPRT